MRHNDENRKKIDRQANPRRRFIIGLFVVLIGFLLLAKNFDLISSDISVIIFDWKVIVMAIGFLLLFANRNKTSGIITMLVGAVFFIPDYFNLSFDYWKVVWPSLIILAGIAMLFRARKITGLPKFEKGNEQYMDIACILGGVDKRMTNKDFKGGKLTAIMGGAKLDLSQVEIEGNVAVLDMFTIMGGAEIIIPDNWEVKLEVTSILGGFDQSKVGYNRSEKPVKTLVIKGLVILGGGEISSY